MENLVARARISMLVLLVGVGGLVWAALESTPDVVALGRRVAENIDWMRREVLPEDLKTYRRYQQADDTPFDREMIVRGLTVTEVLALRRGLRYVDFVDLYEDRDEAAMEEFRKVSEAINEIEAAYTMSDVSGEATLARLEQRLRTTIQVPLVDRPVEASRAIAVWTLAFVVIFLYLFSLAEAMRSRARLIRDEKGIDFVFFHPTPLGPILGATWLLMPGVAAVLLTARGFTPALFGVLTAVILLVLATLIVWRLMVARGSFQLALRALDRESEERQAANPGDRAHG